MTKLVISLFLVALRVGWNVFIDCCPGLPDFMPASLSLACNIGFGVYQTLVLLICMQIFRDRWLNEWFEHSVIYREDNSHH